MREYRRNKETRLIVNAVPNMTAEFSGRYLMRHNHSFYMFIEFITSALLKVLENTRE